MPRLIAIMIDLRAERRSLVPPTWLLVAQSEAIAEWRRSAANHKPDVGRCRLAQKRLIAFNVYDANWHVSPLIG